MKGCECINSYKIVVIIGIIGFGTISIWLLRSIYTGFKTGYVSDRFESNSRDTDPISFWVVIIAQIAVTLFCIYQAVQFIVVFINE